MPIYGNDPQTVKQWQRIEHIVESGFQTNSLLGPLWNELGDNQQFLPVTLGTGLDPDRRLVAWVPRRVAIAPAIKVGLEGSSMPTQISYVGFAIQMVELTDQPVHR